LVRLRRFNNDSAFIKPVEKIVRASKEILDKIEGKIPSMDVEKQVVFVEWVASGEELDGVNLIEVDIENGRELKGWFYEGEDYESFYDEEGKQEGIIPKNFRLSEVTEVAYQPFLYRHPLLGTEVEAVIQEARTWKVDTAGRKRRKNEVAVQVVIFDEHWDVKAEQARGFQVLEERRFEERPPVDEIGRAAKKQWVESHRSFLFGNATIIYTRNQDGLMVLWHFRVGDLGYKGIDFPEGLKPPIELGEATFINFS